MKNAKLTSAEESLRSGLHRMSAKVERLESLVERRLEEWVLHEINWRSTFAFSASSGTDTPSEWYRYQEKKSI